MDQLLDQERRAPADLLRRCLGICSPKLILGQLATLEPALYLSRSRELTHLVLRAGPPTLALQAQGDGPALAVQPNAPHPGATEHDFRPLMPGHQMRHRRQHLPYPLAASRGPVVFAADKRCIEYTLRGCTILGRTLVYTSSTALSAVSQVPLLGAQII